MKVALFYPPVGNSSQPYLSTPTLAAYLEQNGVDEVSQHDLNIEAMDELLSQRRLLRAYRWCYHYLERKSAASRLSDVEAMKLQLALGAVMIGRQTVADIDDAKEIFRSPRFYQSEHYQHALDTVRQGFQLLSARYFPTVVSNQSLTMGYRMDSSEEILGAVHDERENCFIDLLSERLEEILEGDGTPDIAGVSIGYYEQIVPGLTLAGLIKRRSPRTHVTVGGTMLSALADKEFRPEFFELFDSAVFFEGELPLLRLVEAVGKDQGLDTVPSLMFRSNGKTARTPISPPVPPAALPVPNFRGLPFEKYLSPEPILPINGSRGCYWRRCAFCNRQHFFDRYRSLSADTILDHLGTLHERHGARAFFFVDECLSPSLLKALAERIRTSGLDLRWSAYSRFEPRLADRALCSSLAEGGLTMFYFGLESACQRVLDLMKKGTHKQTMARILESSSAAGIRNMVLWFVGFPTETRDEALESMDFLLDNRQHITYTMAGQFLLEEASPVFDNPQEFDVTRIEPLSDHSDLGIVWRYETGSGMSADEAGKVKDLVNERTKELHERDFLNRSHLLLLTGKPHRTLGAA